MKAFMDKYCAWLDFLFKINDKCISWPSWQWGKLHISSLVEVCCLYDQCPVRVLGRGPGTGLMFSSTEPLVSQVINMFILCFCPDAWLWVYVTLNKPLSVLILRAKFVSDSAILPFFAFSHLFYYCFVQNSCLFIGCAVFWGFYL